MDRFILALDQGTTSSRAIVFDRKGRARGMAQREFPQLLPAPGYVEHDGEDLWTSQLDSARAALREARLSAEQIAAVGITNQRETTILWERASGKPIGNAIVWQSRITADLCEHARRQGFEDVIREKTGLVIDPYFSATKIQYLLDRDSEVRAKAERGEVLFGTVDSFLAWRLTGGRLHVTDFSNASRTMLFNIHTLDWDDELLRVFRVPRAMLPRVCASSGIAGDITDELLGASIPLAGIAGDQQAATFGQACFEIGSAKNTYGTGAFLLMNTGERPAFSKHRLLTTIGWNIAGKTTYCLEGSVFVAGAAVQWLRDGLGILRHAREVEDLANSVPDSQGVYFVPGFVGLGAPYWDSSATAGILGITRGTTAAHLARAVVESMALQSRDVLVAMEQDSGVKLAQLKVDGGASANDLLLQFQADILGARVVRPVMTETTALGAAYLAGLAVGYWNGLDDIRANWSPERTFEPAMPPETRERIVARWRDAVRRCLAWNTA